MKRISLFLVFFSFIVSQAQVDYTQKWEDYYSYNNVKDFTIVNNELLALVDNAIFFYDSALQETQKISSVNGLSGETTSSFHYSESSNKIIIGYETGLIEIIDRTTGKIAIFKDIVNFNYSGNKRINHIKEHNSKLYLATSFAIVVFDLNRLQFGDTYFIGDQSSEVQINQIEVLDNYIYAATVNGLFSANLENNNLIDFANWNKQFTNSFTSISVLNNTIYLASGRILYQYGGSSLINLKTYPQNIVKLKSNNTHLVISTQRRVFINNISNTEIFSYTAISTNPFYFDLNLGFFDGETLFLGTKEFGILKSSLANIPNFDEIHPEGPVSNSPFSISVVNNNLWVVYGGYNSFYTPLSRRLGFGHFNGSNWINTSYNSTYPARDLVHVTVDPFHENRAYISSWQDGMLVVENDEISAHWNHTNSGLESLFYAPAPSYKNTRINGSAFDSDGNLWIANAWVDNRIKKYSTTGSWSSFDMSSTLTTGQFGLNELVIDKLNTIFIGTRNNGVLVFNENGNKKTALSTESNNGALPDLNVRSVRIDSKNRLWIGTKSGLVVYYNVSNIFNETSKVAEPIIILDDGIAKKLLGDQPINTIEIDGADNKWFGTEFSGVFNTTPNGSEVLQSFTTDNSPLPSNNILKIAIDKSSGKIFFATDKGIVAFNSSVVPYGENLPEVYAFPNPSTKSNEFITISGRNGTNLPKGTNIKITDIAGNLVFETNTKEGQELFGGKVLWNKRNLFGKKVASGVYMVFIYVGDSGENTFTKIAIIN